MLKHLKGSRILVDCETDELYMDLGDGRAKPLGSGEGVIIKMSAGSLNGSKYHPCVMSASHKVKNAASGVAPIGVVFQGKDEDSKAVIQLQGMISGQYSGSAPSLGYQDLVADGSGGWRVPGSDEVGRSVIVLGIDTNTMTLDMYLL